jgi:hypothetical protein
MAYDDSYAQDNGHPPVAARTVCVDFDRTIIPWGPLMEPREPFAGAREALQRLRDAGYRIVILTSRMSETWWTSEADARGVEASEFGTAQLRYVRAVLEQYGLPFDRITAEKVPAIAYFDDRAWRVSPGERSLDNAVRAFLKEQR